MLDHLYRHPSLDVVVTVILYVSWRTGSLVWQVQSLYGAGAFQTWAFMLVLVFMEVSTIDSIVDYMGWILDRLPGRRPKAALALGVVALTAFISRCLGHFAFWLMSRNPWAGSTDGFLELQVNATSAIAMTFALASMASALCICYELWRLAVWWDLPNRWPPSRPQRQR